MRISENKMSTAQLEAYRNDAGMRQTGASGDRATLSDTRSTDRVSLSDTAKQIQAARSMMDNVPDVRSETVARLKAQIQDGTYRIDSRQIASNMIEASLVDVFC